MSPTPATLHQLAHQSAEGAGRHLVLAFHSAHSPDPSTGGYVIYSEHFTVDNWDNGGDPIDGSGTRLIANATDNHDEAWRICRYLADSAVILGQRAVVS